MNKICFLLIIFLTVSCQSDLTNQTQENKTKIEIGERFSLTSKFLKEEREIYISVPSNYDNSVHSYPIIVVLDAEYLFEITNAITKIKASRNEMPESIVVGIPNNTGKRYDMAMELSNTKGEYFFGKGHSNAKDYLKFFRKELFPFLEKKYRINSGKTIIGMSPTFSPVLESFWNEPDLFDGYIILAAELSLKTISGETIAQKIRSSLRDSLRPKSAIYVGKADDDLKRRPKEEAEAFIELNEELALSSNPKVRHKFEVLENENHYGMSITGIQNGLETIYPKSEWNVPYRDFWSSENPSKEIKMFYDELSESYGFNVVPLESSFYSAQTLIGTIKRLERQDRIKESKEVLSLALEYYPNSEEIRELREKYK
nr:alpha/beta hydrolase-fold protein [uncultured Allomuricauda sp.]